jgi:hypothetical protein
VIRSYGGLFRRDWRIYSIPDGRGGRRPLPVHGGVPVRAVGYFMAVAALTALGTLMPVLGSLLEPLGWVMKYLGLPAVVAFGLTRIEPEGRPALRFLAGWVSHRVAPRCTSAGRPVPADGGVSLSQVHLALAPDAGLPGEP